MASGGNTIGNGLIGALNDGGAENSKNANQAYSEGKLNWLQTLLAGGLPGGAFLTKYLTENDPNPVASPVAPVTREDLPPLPMPPMATLNTPSAPQQVQLNTPTPQPNVQLNTPTPLPNVKLLTPLEYHLNKLLAPGQFTIQ